MRSIYLALTLFIFSIQVVQAQINAKLMRYADVSADQICFTYGGDIWLVPIEGGTAYQITNSPGEESYPRFSPDGQTIAFTAQYHGNLDVYTMPITGGIPKRVTYNSSSDRTIDWHPNGEDLLFASRRELGQRSSRQFFMVNKNGGLPDKLDIPYGELATFSPDGDQLAYITKITENYPFKRYRGGLSSDILLYDFATNQVDRITEHHGNDGQPAWAGDLIYFLSDRGDNIRLNIWSYHVATKEFKQITTFKDFDISRMTAGPNHLVFEAGGAMYLLDLSTEEYKPVDIHIVSDLSAEISRSEDVSRDIMNMTCSPEAKRIVFEARGELFNVPQEEGYSVNLTRSSGSFDREPAWSPDGKHLAFWSDRSGEWEIYLQSPDASSEAKKLTNRGKGYGYQLFWSPDSKKIAYINEENNIYCIDVSSGEQQLVTHTLWNISHPGRNFFEIRWSPNSEWITFSHGLENGNNAVFLYHLETKELTQATSGFYDEFLPAFGVNGDYLFFMTDRPRGALYSDMGDGTWVYPNATHLAVMTLRKEVPSLLPTKSDIYEVVEEEKEEQEEKDEEDKENSEKEEVEIEDEQETEELIIDIAGLESRIRILPVDPGNMSDPIPFDGKLVFMRYANSGSAEGSSSLVYYDLEEQEEKEIMANVGNVKITPDGSMLMVSSRGKYGVIKPSSGQKLEDPIPTDGLTMDLIPKEEWTQIFNDAWRRHRDFFYDPNMHGLDWTAVGQQYRELIADARTRWDVNYIISNLVSELSAGHTYTGGGDVENWQFKSDGYLGIDWTQDSKGFRIKRIVKPAAWDTDVRSPFDEPGMEVDAGYYIHAVNGIELNSNMDPQHAFSGLSGQTVQLKVSSNGMLDSAKSVIVELLTSGEENRLRYLEWIEHNRKTVDSLSDGKIGYVYMSNTSSQGQRELVQMYYGQVDRKGFIIDERFNGGGQLADRFLELIQRPITNYLHWRHGKDHPNPIKANLGPKAMLINGWAGSGGDALPWAFQELEAGPIIGERTLGILVGPATGHRLIDGGRITVPGARLYDIDGHWFWEGEGVSPDIEVWDDPNLLMQGRDPQLERAVSEVMKLLETEEPMATPAPKLEDRTAKGLKAGKE